MPTARDLLDAEELEQARLDLLAKKLRQPAAERIDELLHDPRNRDEELWRQAGVPDVTVTVDDYEEVPVAERDFLWVAGLAALTTAARLQVFAEERAEVLKAYERRRRDVNGLQLPPDELEAAAIQGISKAEIKRRTRELEEIEEEPDESPIEELATIAALRRLSNADYIDELQAAEMIPSWNVAQQAAVRHTSRMIEYRTGSESFLSAKSVLIDSQSNDGIVTLLRRSSQQFTTLDEIDSPDDELIWITEGDSSVCSPCKRRGGVVKTYSEWRVLGMPGAGVCLGEDRCRCDLRRV